MLRPSQGGGIRMHGGCCRAPQLWIGLTVLAPPRYLGRRERCARRRPSSTVESSSTAPVSSRFGGGSGGGAGDGRHRSDSEVSGRLRGQPLRQRPRRSRSGRSPARPRHRQWSRLPAAERSDDGEVLGPRDRCPVSAGLLGLGRRIDDSGGANRDGGTDPSRSAARVERPVHERA